MTLREILVSVPKDASAAAESSARQKAADLQKRAKLGEAFDQLAAAESDSPSKANGGLVGPLSMRKKHASSVISTLPEEVTLA